LLADYVEKVLESLDGIAAEAAGMSPRQLAEAFVAYRIKLKEHRRVAFVLVDAGGDMAGQRGGLGVFLRARLAEILRAAFPDISEARATEMARLTQHILKAVSETSPEEKAVAADVADLLEAYFTKR
jgi:hypothetical protein